MLKTYYRILKEDYRYTLEQLMCVCILTIGMIAITLIIFAFE